MYQSKIENCESLLKVCPYGWVGDVLWVRETWAMSYDTEDHPELPGCPQEIWDTGYVYKADGKPFYMIDKWKSPRFMPKAASRIKLEITDIRVEKLCDITEEDAMAEGSERGIYRTGPKYTQFHLELNHHASYKDGYKFIWETINGKDSWGKNPWVWVLSFKKVNALETSESPLKEQSLFMDILNDERDENS
jgi:hypothetical protein